MDLLLGHPQAEIADVVDVENVGMPIAEKFPHLKGFCDQVIQSPDAVEWGDDIDVAFTATPDGVGMRYAQQCVDSGTKLVDFSGDFRFNTPEAYAEYAGRLGRSADHAAADLLGESAYGIAELHRDAIRNAKIVGNPGCFAVSCILGAAPAVKAGLVDPASLIFDSKTGISGAGIKPAATFHYPSRYENMNAYKIAKHQHCMEIERELGLLAGDKLQVTLTTQVLPVCRGIMTTVYADMGDGVSADDLLAAYREFYADSYFVRVAGPDGSASNNDVRASNFCVVWVNTDPRTGRMIVMSHIDNLMKGQAGSALQNMNLVCGLEEKAGLERPAMFP